MKKNLKKKTSRKKTYFGGGTGMLAPRGTGEGAHPTDAGARRLARAPAVETAPHQPPGVGNGNVKTRPPRVTRRNRPPGGLETYLRRENLRLLGNIGLTPFSQTRIRPPNPETGLMGPRELV